MGISFPMMLADVVDRYNKAINTHALNRFNSSYGIEIRPLVCVSEKKSKGEYSPVTENGSGRGLPCPKFFYVQNFIYIIENWHGRILLRTKFFLYKNHFLQRTRQVEDFLALNFYRFKNSIFITKNWTGQRLLCAKFFTCSKTLLSLQRIGQS